MQGGKYAYLASIIETEKSCADRFLKQCNHRLYRQCQTIG